MPASSARSAHGRSLRTDVSLRTCHHAGEYALHDGHTLPVVTAIVVLAALDLEYRAVRQHLDQLRTRVHPAGTLFEVGSLPGNSGAIALAVTGEGNVGAAVLTERAIGMFRPRALLCAGIAGALKEDIALGDVVVATKVYAMHSGREHDDGFLARPRVWHASHELEQVARHVAQAATWTGRIPRNRAPTASSPPTVHFKPVASGEVVLTATGASLPAVLRGTYDDAVAIEMESAGIAQAAHLNRSLPVLSVRGISDRADAHKHVADAAGWRRIAAERAAAFAMTIAALLLGHQLPATDLQASIAVNPPFPSHKAPQRYRRSLPVACRAAETPVGKW